MPSIPGSTLIVAQLYRNQSALGAPAKPVAVRGGETHAAKRAERTSEDVIELSADALKLLNDESGQEVRFTSSENNNEASNQMFLPFEEGKSQPGSASEAELTHSSHLEGSHLQETHLRERPGVEEDRQARLLPPGAQFDLTV